MTDQIHDRDPFALAGRNGETAAGSERLFPLGAERPAIRSAGRLNDRILLEAEREIAAFHAQLAEIRARGDDADYPEIWDRISVLERKIAKTAPGSLSGAAVKLRYLSDLVDDATTGLSSDDPLAMAQVRAIVERLVEQGVDGRVIPGDADETIRTLFRRWIVGRAGAERIDTSLAAEPQYDAAIGRLAELEHQIAEIPAAGVVGMAIKAYLARYYHDEDGAGPASSTGALAPLDTETYGDDPEQFVCAHCVVAAIRDAARFVPEMALLAAPLTRPGLGLSRKAPLAAKKAAALIKAKFPSVTAEKVQRVADSLARKKVTDIYVSHLDEDAEMPLSMRLADGTCRRGTDDELIHHLKYHPSDYEHVAPAVLRRLWPAEDRELFALLAERRSLCRHDDPEGLGENLRQICEAPAVTDAGVIAKLRLLTDATWGHGPRLSPFQQRQLLSSALDWLCHPRFKDDRVPMEVRALDFKERAENLKKFDPEPGAVPHAVGAA